MKKLILLAAIVLGAIAAKAQVVEIAISGVAEWDTAKNSWTEMKDYSGVLYVDYGDDSFKFFYKGKTYKVQGGNEIKKEKTTLTGADSETDYTAYKYTQYAMMGSDSVWIECTEPTKKFKDDYFCSFVIDFGADNGGIQFEIEHL